MYISRDQQQAVDYEQINFICEMNYVNDFTQGNIQPDTRIVDRCRELARDYITKVLPIDSRIFMPDVKKLKNIVIESENYRITVKSFLINKIAERLGIFYDRNGLKVHFCEATSVRELVDYNQFLDSLDEMGYAQWDTSAMSDDERKAKMIAYDKNHERFNWDINKRLSNKLLNDKNRNIFENLIRKKLEHRAAYVCQMAWEELNDKRKNSKSGNYEDAYSYGDLLEVIYKLGRKSDQEKALVKCLLASFTSELVREYVNYQKNSDEDARNRSFVRLKGFIGKSFGGNWLNDLLPPMDVSGKLTGWAYTERSTFRLKASFKIDQAAICIDSESSVEERFNKFSDWLENSKVIPTLEILLMFFENEDENEAIDIVMEIGKEADSIAGKECLIVQGNSGMALYDVMGFVKKTLDYERKYKETQNMISRALITAVKKYLETGQKISDEDAQRIEDEIKTKVEKLSIHTQLKWEFADKNVAFPFYDFDLSYNIIKRVRRMLLESNPQEIGIDQCFEYITKLYSSLYKFLRKECDELIKENYIYDTVYFTCPFIKAIIKYDKYLHEDFAQLVNDTVLNSLNPVKLGKKDEIDSL